MPNWVWNSVVISGDATKIRELDSTINAIPPVMYYDKEEEREVRRFSFLNIIAPPQEHWVEYNCGDNTPQELITGFNWYAWNSRNWDTKWDACDTEYVLENTLDDRAVISVRFNTAWSPPRPILYWFYLTCRDAGLELDVYYEEETGWGGEFSLFSNGNFTYRYWDECEGYDEEAEEFIEAPRQEGTFQDWLNDWEYSLSQMDNPITTTKKGN